MTTEPADPNEVDVALLRRIAEGDASAVTELFDRYAGLLYGLVLHILRNSTDAEHVLLDLFVHLREQTAAYHAHLGRPVAWLIGLARQRAVDRLRARPVHTRTPDLDRQDRHQPGPKSGLIREQQAAAVALASLPAEQRLLIEQAFFLGFTHTELASRNRIPLAIVQARIRTGMTVLRQQLLYLSRVDGR